MAAEERPDSDRGARVPFLIMCVLVMAGVGLSPIILGIGQAYGVVSAMVAVAALVAVTVSMLLQRTQFRAMRIQLLERTNTDLVQLAMVNPAFRQCWGSRVSPPHIGEELFYYCSLMIKLWTDSWDQRKIDESLVREYLRKFFDSEVPRIFWEKFGDWHRPGPARNHRDRFRVMANEEFLRALRAGPPGRAYEDLPPSTGLFP